MKLHIAPSLAVPPHRDMPSDWAARAMFSHPDAAEVWARRVTMPEAAEQLSDVMSMYVSVVRRCPVAWRHLVSIGAGDGCVDHALLRHTASGPVGYVPIELSTPMCRRAAATVRECCPVPFGIVADFESEADYIRDALSEQDGPKLIACLGNMIGNTDAGELNLIRNVNSLMKPNDCFLLSLATGAFERPMDRAMFDATVGWHDLAGLLALGIARMTAENAAAIEPALDERLEVRDGVSDVPSGDTVVLWDRISGRRLLNLRRYGLLSVGPWIEEHSGLRTIAYEHVQVSLSGVGIGTLLLMRR